MTQLRDGNYSVVMESLSKCSNLHSSDECKNGCCFFGTVGVLPDGCKQLLMTEAKILLERLAEEGPSIIPSSERSVGQTGEIKNDPVNHPSHYTQGGVECKDAIKAAVTALGGYEGFLTGNAIKYLWRWKLKNGAEDLRKAAFWIQELIGEMEARHGIE